MTTISDQQRFYDDRWASFEYPGRLEVDRISTVIDLMRDVGSYGRICDLGCGAGWIAGVLGHFGKTMGVDLSDVEKARARFPNCEFVSANILEWKHPRESFDLVVSSEVIEHIPYARQSDYLRVAHDVLVPGGHLILTTPNKTTMDAIRGGGRSWTNQPIEDWLDRRSLSRLLKDAGFQVKKSTSITLGIADMGMHRVINSPRLNLLFEGMGLSDLWRDLALRLYFGVHIAILAEKPADANRKV